VLYIYLVHNFCCKNMSEKKDNLELGVNNGLKLLCRPAPLSTVSSFICLKNIDFTSTP
jgi:hypothetical protein